MLGIAWLDLAGSDIAAGWANAGLKCACHRDSVGVVELLWGGVNGCLCVVGARESLAGILYKAFNCRVACVSLVGAACESCAKIYEGSLARTHCPALGVQRS